MGHDLAIVNTTYVLALKDNHPTLHEEVAFTFAQARAEGKAERVVDELETVNGGHGRIERRGTGP